MEGAHETDWTAADLLDRLERPTSFAILDVRNRDEFERFRLEGRGVVAALNVPYFEILEVGGKEDMVDCVVAYVERHLAERLPRNLPVLSVCAKGDTSELVAQGLRRLGYTSANLAGGMRAWGEYYAVHTVIDTADLAIYQISRPARGCLSYVVAGRGKAAVIDPLRHQEPYLALARSKGLTIESVVDTHAHADHITGGPALAAATGASYYLHPYDAIHPIDLLPATISYEPIRDGQIFPVGSCELEALHIPGHTLGLVALRLGDRCLFTGDSIFVRAIARPDLGGKAETWARLHARSLRTLLGLPGEISVLPGHASSLAETDETGLVAASLDDLKQRNESFGVLQRESEDGFVRYLLASLPKFIPEYMDIKRVNLGLLRPGEDDAWALELGRNVCALAQAYESSTVGGLQ